MKNRERWLERRDQGCRFDMKMKNKEKRRRNLNMNMKLLLRRRNLPINQLWVLEMQ
jgi:hypothetical protein